jgi:hypothetical protein
MLIMVIAQCRKLPLHLLPQNPEPILVTVVEQTLVTTDEPMFALKSTSVTTSIPSHAMEAVANIILGQRSCRNNCSILGTHTNSEGFFEET